MSEPRRYDAIVVGSGFGGSVAALRLAEKGYRVAVLEQGRRVTPDDMRAAQSDLRRLLWAPALGSYGFFYQRVLRHVGIVGGAGVGGGSLVYAAVLLEPKAGFYADPIWRELGVDLATELAPHYATAARMLGRAENPYRGLMDTWLEGTARKLGVERTFGSVPQGIYFGDPRAAEHDPYFAAQGPPRRGCTQCGACLTGCAEGAKNSLDKNYLFFAERRGAEILERQRVEALRPRSAGGYELEARDPLDPRGAATLYRADKVFLAAGVLGTLELLLRARDEHASLPRLSPTLGRVVRTNSEAIVGILAPDPTLDLTQGTAISTHFYANERTHITQNRFPRGYSFMRFYMGPLVDGTRPLWRALKSVLTYLLAPHRSLRSLFARHWYKRISVLTVMQSTDHRISLRLGRSLFTGFRRALVSGAHAGASPTAYIPEANEAARAFAEVSGGTAHNVVAESIGNLSVTAHVLGGACIGASPERGVVDAHHEVFHYPGLYVLDGSALPINVGVNPSLTITAMAERCMASVPPFAADDATVKRPPA